MPIRDTEEINYNLPGGGISDTPIKKTKENITYEKTKDLYDEAIEVLGDIAQAGVETGKAMGEMGLTTLHQLNRPYSGVTEGMRETIESAKEAYNEPSATSVAKAVTAPLWGMAKGAIENKTGLSDVHKELVEGRKMNEPLPKWFGDMSGKTKDEQMAVLKANKPLDIPTPPKADIFSALTTEEGAETIAPLTEGIGMAVDPLMYGANIGGKTAKGISLEKTGSEANTVAEQIAKGERNLINVASPIFDVNDSKIKKAYEGIREPIQTAVDNTVNKLGAKGAEMAIAAYDAISKVVPKATGIIDALKTAVTNRTGIREVDNIIEHATQTSSAAENKVNNALAGLEVTSKTNPDTLADTLVSAFGDILNTYGEHDEKSFDVIAKVIKRDMDIDMSADEISRALSNVRSDDAADINLVRRLGSNLATELTTVGNDVYERAKAVGEDPFAHNKGRYAELLKKSIESVSDTDLFRRLKKYVDETEWSGNLVDVNIRNNLLGESIKAKVPYPVANVLTSIYGKDKIQSPITKAIDTFNSLWKQSVLTGLGIPNFGFTMRNIIGEVGKSTQAGADLQDFIAANSMLKSLKKEGVAFETLKDIPSTNPISKKIREAATFTVEDGNIKLSSADLDKVKSVVHDFLKPAPPINDLQYDNLIKVLNTPSNIGKEEALRSYSIAKSVIDSSYLNSALGDEGVLKEAINLGIIDTGFLKSELSNNSKSIRPKIHYIAPTTENNVKYFLDSLTLNTPHTANIALGWVNPKHSPREATEFTGAMIVTPESFDMLPKIYDKVSELFKLREAPVMDTKDLPAKTAKLEDIRNNIVDLLSEYTGLSRESITAPRSYSTQEFAPVKDEKGGILGYLYAYMNDPLGSKSIAGWSENMARLAVFNKYMRDGYRPEAAARKVGKFNFNYQDISSEAQMLKKIYPFLTFYLKNIPLQIGQFFENPRVQRLTAQLANAGVQSVDLDELQDYQKEGVPFKVNGLMDKPIEIGSFLPQKDVYLLKDLASIFKGEKKAIDVMGDALFSGAHPVLKALIEVSLGTKVPGSSLTDSSGGFSTFTNQPIEKFAGEGADFLPGVSKKTEHVVKSLVPQVSRVEDWYNAMVSKGKYAPEKYAEEGKGMTGQPAIDKLIREQAGIKTVDTPTYDVETRESENLGRELYRLEKLADQYYANDEDGKAEEVEALMDKIIDKMTGEDDAEYDKLKSSEEEPEKGFDTEQKMLYNNKRDYFEEIIEPMEETRVEVTPLKVDYYDMIMEDTMPISNTIDKSYVGDITNHGSRKGTPIDKIVLHSTGSDKAGESSVVNWFKNPSSQVSAHYLITEDGRIIGLVDEDRRAWHAGKANSSSIGIEVQGRTGIKQYNDAQKTALSKLIADIRNRYGNLPLTTHSDFDKVNKGDDPFLPAYRTQALGELEEEILKAVKPVQ